MLEIKGRGVKTWFRVPLGLLLIFVWLNAFIGGIVMGIMIVKDPAFRHGDTPWGLSVLAVAFLIFGIPGYLSAIRFTLGRSKFGVMEALATAMLVGFGIIYFFLDAPSRPY